MINISCEEFLHLVEQRRPRRSHHASRKKRVLRPDQKLVRRRPQYRCLSTCPSCDFVVDAQLLHPVTNLCPRCQQAYLGGEQ